MPDWTSEIRSRLSSLRLPPARELDIIDELSQHLQDRYTELIAGGTSPDEAKRLALVEFRTPNGLADRLAPLRQANTRPSMTPGAQSRGLFTDLWFDVRYAVRQSSHRPAFTAVIVATLALCLAANTGIFAVIDAVMLRALPFPEPDRLVAIYNTYPGAGADIAPNSAMDFVDRRKLPALADLATFQRTGLTVASGPAESERVMGLIASPSLFAVIGSQPFLGRLLLETDAIAGAEQRVLLTHGYWQRVFAGRPSAVGETLRVNGAPFTVIGVLPADWRFINPDVQIVIPPAFTAQDLTPQRRHRNNNWQQLGRLANGATVETLQDQIDALNAANLEAMPEMRQALTNIGFTTRVAPFQEFIVGQAARILYFLWGGVIVVLLIGAINVSSMVLVRAAVRRREWATRIALGAGSGRLLRQSLIESWLVTAVGASVGLLLAVWLLSLAPSLGLDELPRGTEIALNLRVLIFVVLLTLLVGTALGLLPILTHRPRAALQAMREESRTGTASRSARVARRALASVQVAGALILLVAGGMLLASLQRVLSVDIGFRPERLLTAQLSLSAIRYPTAREIERLTDQLSDRLRQLPGIEAAGLSSLTPFSGGVSNNPMLAEGYEMAPGESIVAVNHVSVSDHYFETVGARLLAGRWFDAGDVEGRRRVIVIDDRVARKFFPDGNAVGRRMWPLRGTERMFAPPPDDQMLTVIGVVAEMRLTDVVDDPGTRTNGSCYYPFRQRASRVVGLAIRTIGEPAMIIGTVRRAVAGLDPEMPLHLVDAVTNLIDRSLVDRRTPALVAAGFAAVALLLATLGVYGVLAYHVSQRTREFGIRMALGADARRIFTLVLSDGGLIVGVGVLAGLAGALLAVRSIESQLYGVSAFDPAIVIGVIGALALVALLAISIPARRAARTQPTIALTDVQ